MKSAFYFAVLLLTCSFAHGQSQEVPQEVQRAARILKDAQGNLYSLQRERGREGDLVVRDPEMWQRRVKEEEVRIRDTQPIVDRYNKEHPEDPTYQALSKPTFKEAQFALEQIFSGKIEKGSPIYKTYMIRTEKFEWSGTNTDERIRFWQEKQAFEAAAEITRLSQERANAKFSIQDEIDIDRAIEFNRKILLEYHQKRPEDKRFDKYTGRGAPEVPIPNTIKEILANYLEDLKKGTEDEIKLGEKRLILYRASQAHPNDPIFKEYKDLRLNKIDLSAAKAAANKINSMPSLEPGQTEDIRTMIARSAMEDALSEYLKESPEGSYFIEKVDLNKIRPLGLKRILVSQQVLSPQKTPTELKKEIEKLEQRDLPRLQEGYQSSLAEGLYDTHQILGKIAMTTRELNLLKLELMIAEGASLEAAQKELKKLKADFGLKSQELAELRAREAHPHERLLARLKEAEIRLNFAEKEARGAASFALAALNRKSSHSEKELASESNREAKHKEGEKTSNRNALRDLPSNVQKSAGLSGSGSGSVNPASLHEGNQRAEKEGKARPGEKDTERGRENKEGRHK